LVSPERLAEAGVWIARLHGDSRGRALENGFRRWLQENPENARAFELATEVWDDAEQLRRFVPLRPRVRAASGSSWRGPLAAATFGMLMIAAGIVWFLQMGVIATKVGEQRQVVLDDGTRVFLNTDTRVVVKYGKEARRVELTRGEALFNVAKKPDWPFIVAAGDRQVRALGTSFVVRRDEQRLAVTLVEGEVMVSPRLAAASDGAVSSSSQPDAGAIAQTPPAAAGQPRNDVFTLAPGQRLTFTAGAATRLDTPSVEKATAWRRGQVILDDTPLATAVVEMNRYNSVKLVVERPEAAALLVNGLFQAGDSTHFANAVAQAYGLRLIERDGQIILSGQPGD
jgi:transmembrane sensor